MDWSGFSCVRVYKCVMVNSSNIVKIMSIFFFLMIRRPPRSTQSRSSAASDVYKRQVLVLFFVIVDTFGLGLENMSNIPPLAFICIATLSDFFIRQYIKKSIKTSVVTLLGTILVAIAGWFVITRDIISNYILNNLWIIPLLTLFNILLGTFKGLRIKDLFRFRFTTREDEK